jgi:hypothetical protein
MLETGRLGGGEDGRLRTYCIEKVVELPTVLLSCSLQQQN